MRKMKKTLCEIGVKARCDIYELDRNYIGGRGSILSDLEQDWGISSYENPRLSTAALSIFVRGRKARATIGSVAISGACANSKYSLAVSSTCLPLSRKCLLSLL